MLLSWHGSELEVQERIVRLCHHRTNCQHEQNQQKQHTEAALAELFVIHQRQRRAEQNTGNQDLPIVVECLHCISGVGLYLIRSEEREQTGKVCAELVHIRDGKDHPGEGDDKDDIGVFQNVCAL